MGNEHTNKDPTRAPRDLIFDTLCRANLSAISIGGKLTIGARHQCEHPSVWPEQKRRTELGVDSTGCPLEMGALCSATC